MVFESYFAFSECSSHFCCSPNTSSLSWQMVGLHFSATLKLIQLYNFEI